MGKPHRKPTSIPYTQAGLMRNSLPRTGFNILTKESVKSIRIIIPDKTIKGKRVGIIRSNQRFKPFSAKERQSAGKSRITAVRTKARKVYR